MSNLVSIIIPCFNSAEWISEAIESALNQTWSSVEVVVIDDGSTDNSTEIIKKFGDSISWKTQPNGGGALARNRGIELATGEWVQFLDADDLLLPDAVEHKLKLSVDPSVVICGNVSSIDGASTESLPGFWNLPSYDLESMLRSGAPPTSAPLHRINAIRSIGGFHAGQPCGQEYDLHLRMAIELGLTFRSTQRNSVLIRQHDQSVSRTAGPKMALAVGNLLSRAANRLEARGEFSPQLRKAFAPHAARLARTLWQLGARQEACRLAEHARSSCKDWSRGAYSTTASELLARSIGFHRFEKLHDQLDQIRRWLPLGRQLPANVFHANKDALS